MAAAPLKWWRDAADYFGLRLPPGCLKLGPRAQEYFKKFSRGGTNLGLESDFDESDYDEADPDISEDDSDSFIDDSEERGWESTDDESDCGKNEEDEEDWELDASGQCDRIILHEEVAMDATDEEYDLIMVAEDNVPGERRRTESKRKHPPNEENELKPRCRRG
ncbi:hypothetical protein Plec18170_001606 [Paecilomyces lecythidis]